MPIEGAGRNHGLIGVPLGDSQHRRWLGLHWGTSRKVRADLGAQGDQVRIRAPSQSGAASNSSRSQPQVNRGSAFTAPWLEHWAAVVGEVSTEVARPMETQASRLGAGPAARRWRRLARGKQPQAVARDPPRRQNGVDAPGTLESPPDLSGEFSPNKDSIRI
jgi:hypothetical protein